MHVIETRGAGGPLMAWLVGELPAEWSFLDCDLPGRAWGPSRKERLPGVYFKNKPTVFQPHIGLWIWDQVLRSFFPQGVLSHPGGGDPGHKQPNSGKF